MMCCFIIIFLIYRIIYYYYYFFFCVLCVVLLCCLLWTFERCAELNINTTHILMDNPILTRAIFTERKAERKKRQSRTRVVVAPQLNQRVPKQQAERAFTSDGSQLYPTIALSDAYNTIMHCACRITYSHNEFIGLGFLLVATASFVGTLRFGFSEKAFATANGQLASAALVGLPHQIANVERLFTQAVA